MLILKWIAVILAAINFGFMAFDGLRALIIGDYIRPRSGKYRGQLGPWSKTIHKLGMNPESKLMMFIYFLWGMLGLSIALSFAMGFAHSWVYFLVISIFTLWYSVPGTVLSIMQITLLLALYFWG